jgi:hypothetical protein
MNKIQSEQKEISLSTDAAASLERMLRRRRGDETGKSKGQ